MRRSSVMHLAVYGFYLLIAVIVTYPLIAQLSTAFVGFVYGDAYEMAQHIWWFKHALQTGQPLFYQTMLGYPSGISAVVNWADPLQFFPAWLFAFVMPLASAANLQILLTLALNGWAMFYLMCYLIGEMHNRAPRQSESSAASVGAQRATSLQNLPSAVALAASLIAGLVFMLFPAMQGHLGAGHAGLIVQWGVPLFVWALLRLRTNVAQRRGGWRRIGLAVLFFLLSLGGYTLQLIYVLMPLLILYGLMLILRREWAALRRTVIVVVIGGLLLGAFLLPVFGATFSSYGDEGGAVRYSADLLAIFTPSFRHPLFGQLGYPARVLGVNLDEGAAYVGMVAALLALIAVWKVRAARWWLALALIAWVLALGPLLKVFDQPVTFSVDGYTSYVTLPFALIADLPLIRLARAPGRFDFALALAVAALAGYGAAYLWSRLRWRTILKWAGALILMTLIAFEYQIFWPLPLSPAAIPPAIAALDGRSDVRAVFDIPWDNLIAAKDALYLQTAHERPLIAGQETRRTPVSPAKLALLQTLDPALLRSAGADAVIVHREQDGDGALEALARRQLGDPVYEDQSLALFKTPSNAGTDSPPYTTLASPLTAITTQADSYVYAPEDGWVTFSADLHADDARNMSLLLDEVVVQRWTLNGETTISVPLPVRANSFQTISLALDPACPDHFDPALACRSVGLANVKIDYMAVQASVSANVSATFEKGVTLARAYLPPSAQAGGSLAVWLWWRFDQARNPNEIRFVHVTDAAGKLVAQQDNTLGTIPAGETRAEAVEIALPADLPVGTYMVSVGWYTYPAITNFCILSNGACGERALTLGTVAVSR